MHLASKHLSVGKTMAILLLYIVSNSAFSHGGVVAEEDLCLLKIGFYQAHFTIYQPATDRHREFCEDLPRIGESIFVLEYLHDGLERMPIDFRIIRNTTGMGTFTSWDDISKLGDLSKLTEFYQPATIDPDLLTVLHTFEKNGEFVGIVTATSSLTEKVYTAVFPFEVGFATVDFRTIAFGLVLSTLFVFGVNAVRRHRTNLHTTALLVFLMLFAPISFAQSNTASGEVLVLSMEQRNEPIPINRMLSFRFSLTNRNGAAITNAEFAVSGGMPQHDHGMPTNPRVSPTQNSGEYLLQGVKFHMPGDWVLSFSVVAGDVRETLELTLHLQP